MTKPDHSGRFIVDEFSIDRQVGAQPADVVVWRRDGEHVQGAVRDATQDYGRVLVRLACDGTYDIVEGYTCQTSDVEALDRAIAAMQEVRDRLAALGHDPSGRCMMTADWGRCKADTGHESPHQFPTEAEWDADQRILSAVRKASA